MAAVIGPERARARARLLAKRPTVELHRVAAKLERVARRLKAAKKDGGRDTRDARSSRWAVDARVARRAAALTDAMREAGAVYVPERLHLVRIALKKLRYALELKADMAGGQAETPRLRSLQLSQELLGRLHDQQLLIDRVRQIQASSASPDLTAWRDLDVLVTTLEDDGRRLHARYMRQRSALDTMCERVGVRTEAAIRRAG